jgi:hypothetical protein
MATLQAQWASPARVAVSAPARAPQEQLALQDSVARPGVACNAIRVAVVGFGGYFGWVMGDAATLLLPNISSDQATGVKIAGALAGVLWIAEAPTRRRMPLCPPWMRTISGRATSRRGCAASMVLNGLFGTALGSIAGAFIAAPLMAGENNRARVNTIIIGGAAAGGVVGAMTARLNDTCSAARRPPPA